MIASAKLKYLGVSAQKTRLVEFHAPGRGPRQDGRPGTFDLLGFTHYWDRSRRGHWVVKLKTAADRFSRALRSIGSWCRVHRHLSIKEQQQTLNAKLRGHYAYYGVTANASALSRFLHEVERRWRKWLLHRNRDRALNWTLFRRLLHMVDDYPHEPLLAAVMEAAR